MRRSAMVREPAAQRGHGGRSPNRLIAEPWYDAVEEQQSCT